MAKFYVGERVMTVIDGDGFKTGDLFKVSDTHADRVALVANDGSERGITVNRDEIMKVPYITGEMVQVNNCDRYTLYEIDTVRSHYDGQSLILKSIWDGTKRYVDDEVITQRQLMNVKEDADLNKEMCERLLKEITESITLIKKDVANLQLDTQVSELTEKLDSSIQTLDGESVAIESFTDGSSNIILSNTWQELSHSELVSLSEVIKTHLEWMDLQNGIK